MSQFVLSTDSCCDIFYSDLIRRRIEVLPMSYCIKEPVFALYDTDEQYRSFYGEMRGGAMPTTSQPNLMECTTYFENLIAKYPDSDILHVTISSGLSGTHDTCRAAAKDVMERTKAYSKKIIVFDPLTTTQGQSYILDLAEDLRDSGISASDAAAKLSELSKRLNHYIVVNDLHHLHRGGRLSKLAAVAGTVLQIKPIIVFNSVGKLVVHDKVKGLTKALNYLVKSINKYGCDLNNQIVIAHTDAPDLADSIREMINEEYKNVKIRTGWVGPVVGSHLGPGAVAIVFLGNPRVK